MNSPANASSAMTHRKVRVETPRARVLIVDDHDEDATAMATYLSRHGYDCRIASGGAQAVGIFLRWKPHLIVMDVSMVGITGVEAALMLRHDKGTKQIAIVAFTALEQEEVKRQMGDHEFDGYFQKGDPPIQLVSLMQEFLLPG